MHVVVKVSQASSTYWYLTTVVLDKIILKTVVFVLMTSRWFNSSYFHFNDINKGWFTIQRRISYEYKNNSKVRKLNELGTTENHRNSSIHFRLLAQLSLNYVSRCVSLLVAYKCDPPRPSGCETLGLTQLKESCAIRLNQLKSWAAFVVDSIIVGLD